MSAQRRIGDPFPDTPGIGGDLSSSPLSALSLSADGELLAAALEQDLVLYDTSSKQAIARLPTSYDLRFSPIGRRLAAADEKGGWVADLDPVILRERACSLVGNRDLTAAEWRRYVAPEPVPDRVCPPH